MKIVFIHYHLKTGGVTTVLKQQIEALKNDHDILVLTGEDTDKPLPSDTVIIKGLGYHDDAFPAPDPNKVAQSVVESIYRRFEKGCDILHVHNPTLAKNRSFLNILKYIQKKGFNLFLQIHDFAEDGRPLAYFPDEYPSDCHYGVINSRDFKMLLQSGLNKNGLHKIDNTVQPIDLIDRPSNIENRVLYPIRAIRRKNIGEAILLSLFFKNRETLAITLPPNSPADIESYQRWKNFVRDGKLNVQFEAGLNQDFIHLVSTSKFLLTTSITEGFGFSFLEPWLADKLLWGRKLPDICEDFEEKNIDLNHLYSRLLVPIEWMGKSKIFKKWSDSIQKNCRLFNIPITSDTIEKSFTQVTSNDCIDFGLLDETLQKNVISQVLVHKSNSKRLIELNPFLSCPGEVENPDKLIFHNKKAILKNYRMDSYNENLIKIYSRVIDIPAKQSIDKRKLLSLFMNFKTYSLLKWGEDSGK